MSKKSITKLASAVIMNSDSIKRIAETVAELRNRNEALSKRVDELEKKGE